MFFQEVNEAQPDPIFGLLGAFLADPRKEKINLLIGIYKDDQLRSELLSSVRRARDAILGQDAVADYLPLDGLSEFVELIGQLICGDSLWKEAHAALYGAQTPGGTAALRVGAEFLAQEVSKKFYIPTPTWANHRSVFERVGCQVDQYPYYSREERGFDFDAMIEWLAGVAEKSVILLHPCCHNPTGCDPTAEQWAEISKVMKKRRLFPFFDFAYQGFGDGPEKDAGSIRRFLEDGHEMAIAYSCSKNFSMYCQRVGALLIKCESPAIKPRIASQVKKIIRALYSNPPAHGARIVAEVLKKSDLRQAWEKDLGVIRHRLNLMRESLIQRLISKARHMDFDYLKKHKGMFSFVDLNKHQVQQLIGQFGIYLTDNGRISIAGLTTKNIDYVVNSLIAVCEEK